MATADIQTAKVAKKQPVEFDYCAYVAGAVYVSDPMRLFDPPRRVTDAKGTLSNERLRAIAEKHHPPQEWYEGEEEQLF
jgi:hypothetical protein